MNSEKQRPLGNLQVTVTGATHLLNRPEAPNGFAFYLIEYQVQNIGTIAFDTTLLTTALFDSFGNQYATNGVASTLGNYPALFGSMNPSQLAQTTVGYQIPLELSGPICAGALSVPIQMPLLRSLFLLRIKRQPLNLPKSSCWRLKYR